MAFANAASRRGDSLDPSPTTVLANPNTGVLIKRWATALAAGTATVLRYQLPARLTALRITVCGATRKETRQTICMSRCDGKIKILWSDRHRNVLANVIGSVTLYNIEKTVQVVNTPNVSVSGSVKSHVMQVSGDAWKLGAAGGGVDFQASPLTCITWLLTLPLPLSVSIPLQINWERIEVDSENIVQVSQED